jgi:muramidase (phage lysozyme)
MTSRDTLLEALQSNNLQAFLRVIREGESSQDDRAYFMRFGGLGNPPAYFDSLDAHPRIFEPTHGGKKSSAAGAYQATWTTWREEQAKYGWPDFSRQSQDEFAVARIIYRGALDAVKSGRFYEACRLCRNEWTSLPGGSEPNSATKRALAVYHEHGGALAAPSDAVPVNPPEKVKPMAPIVLPLLQLASGLIPQLAALFGSGSEVAQRNVAAGKIVADTLVKATEAVNLQEAVERIQTDPQALQAAKEAVAQVWPSITESGGGGIGEARKAAYSADQVPPWKNPAVWVTLVFVPLIYGAAYAVLFVPGFSDEIKVVVITAIFAGLLGSITGFFLGSSLGSQKKDSMMGVAK